MIKGTKVIINPATIQPTGTVSQSLINEINTMSKDPRWLAFIEEENNKEQKNKKITKRKKTLHRRNTKGRGGLISTD